MNTLNSPACCTIEEVDWQCAELQLREVRQRVFIEEQQVPVELEWDGLDEQAIHLLALTADGKAVGCARILSGGIVGRMAVLAQWRGQGVGSTLLTAAITCCRERGWHDIRLSAQTHAIPFYERAGFQICGKEYIDAGISHRNMRLELSI